MVLFLFFRTNPVINQPANEEYHTDCVDYRDEREPAVSWTESKNTPPENDTDDVNGDEADDHDF